ncbi:MAG TPA: hypothetical protein PKD12_15615 [Nitrospira sp.]|nr:hypothetical protein [Nitrospira sp.]
MNAYYSELMFVGVDDELNVPGTATINEDGPNIEIVPVGASAVRSIVLNGDDIVALVELAQRAGMLTPEDITEIRKKLKR